METEAISRFDAFLMFVLILFWGSSFVVVKMVLMEGLTPIAIATFRFLVAGGLFLFAILLERRRVKDYGLFVEKKDFPRLILLAFTGVTFFFTAQYTGIKMAGASIAAIFVCLLAPIFITLLSAKFFKEHLVKRQVFGVGMAAVGTFIVIMGGSVSLQTNQQFFLGSLILLSTPILWATYSLLGKSMMEKYSPFLVVAYVNIFGGLFLIPISLVEGSFSQIFTMNIHGWMAIMFLAVTCSFLGYYIWFYVIKRVGAAVASSFMFAEPLITALFAVAFVGEELSLFVIAGGCLIFIGVYLVTKK